MAFSEETLKWIKTLPEGHVFNHSGRQYQKLRGSEIKEIRPEDPRYAPIKSTPANTGQYGSSPRAQNTTNLYELRRSNPSAGERGHRESQEKDSTRTGRRDDVPQTQQRDIARGSGLDDLTVQRGTASALRPSQGGRNDPANESSGLRPQRASEIALRPKAAALSGTDLLPEPGRDRGSRPLASDIDPSQTPGRHNPSQTLPTNPSRPLRPAKESEDVNSDEPLFTVLQGKFKTFASFAQNDFRRRGAFLAENPGLRKSRLDSFFQEAIHQIVIHEISAALRCMQSLVVLRLCQDIRSDYLESEVLEMQIEDTEQHAAFQEMFEQVCRGAQAQAQAKVDKPREQTRASKETATYVPNPRGTPGHTRNDSKLGYSSYTPDVPETKPDTNRRLTTPKDSDDILEGMTDGAVLPVEMDKNLQKMDPTKYFKSREMRLLSDEYQMPDNGRTFFIPGRVFSLIWHENLGEARSGSTRKTLESEEGQKAGVKDRVDPNITIGPYGEKIHSHIRRMVVIRNRDGYCWCLAINSYQGKALKKPGFKKEQIRAHAIIHDRKYPATPLDDEPKTFKDSIAVRMADGESLSSASRLHYGKPYVVEWNTRVKEVGQVDKSSIPALLADAAVELLGPKQRN